MGDERWFYRDEQDLAALTERLKLISCPHCKKIGTLIRHGSLTGFDDSTPQRKTLRARRIFCSNRHRRPGCGRTFSAWLADKIRRLSTTTRRLWAFLQRAIAGTLAEAMRATGSSLSGQTWQRIWTRFDRGMLSLKKQFGSNTSDWHTASRKLKAVSPSPMIAKAVRVRVLYISHRLDAAIFIRSTQKALCKFTELLICETT